MSASTGLKFNEELIRLGQLEGAAFELIVA